MTRPPSGAPPSLAALLLRILADESDRDHILGDLEEEFRQRVGRSGVRAPHVAWYWGQVLRSTFPLVGSMIARSLRRPPRAGHLLRDLRFSLRGLARRPGFTAIALVTLTVGVGVNTAVFSVVRGVLLRPLPFDEPQELMRVQGQDLSTSSPNNLSPADFMDLERETSTLARMGAHGWIGPATISDGAGQADRIGRVEVTEGYFPTLGVQPVLGRGFTEEDDRPGAQPVAILANGLWRSMFGADPAIIGQTVLVNDRATTVIGVLPPEYRHIEERADRSAEFFTPYGFDRIDPNRGGHFIRAVGRLAPGADLGAARAELATIATTLAGDYPESNTGQGVFIEPLHDSIVGDVAGTLLLLLGAAGLVLLTACANLGNLLLAVGASRERELAVRTAMGASRRRLAGQLLTECLVLGVLGGVGGMLAAFASTGLLTRLSAAGIPRAGDIGVDLVVVVFAALVALAATLAFGLLPALTLPSKAVHGSLGRGGRQSAAVVGRRSREILIAAEVAFSVVLVVGAGLLIATLVELRGVSTGFDPSRVVAMEVAPPLTRYPEGTQIPFHREFGNRAGSLPGIEAIGAVNILPLTSNYDGRSILIEDRPLPEPGERPSAQARSVTVGYFDAMGIPLIRGRTFDSRDADDGPLVVIVSQGMAEEFWPGEDPLGRHITFSSGIPEEELRAACPEIEDPFFCVGGPASREVIGVVGDVKHLDLREETAVPMFYTPNTQPPSYHAMLWVARARTDPSALIAELRSQLADLDPEVPLANVRTLDDILGDSVARPRVRAGLIGLFAMLAVVLACVGVYGVVSFLVTRRRQEMGIRIALGASGARVVALLVREGLRPVLIGIGIGTVTALAVSRVLEGLLFGVSPLHPVAYLLACGSLAAAGLIATLVPARRVLSVNPATTLEDSA